MARDLLHLWRRHQQWYLRLAIPPTLRKHFPSGSGKPKDKIVEPLGTGDLRQAQGLRNQRVAYWEAVFQRLRSGAALSAAEIAEEGRRAYAEARAAYVPQPPPTEAKRLAEKRHLWDWEHVLDLRYRPELGPEIDAIAQRLGTTIEFGTPTWRKLSRTLVEARGAARRGAPLPGADVLNGNVEATAAGGERFSEALEAHLAELARSPIAATTLSGYRMQGAAFVDFSKDAPLHNVTRAMASDFLDQLAKDRTNQTVNAYSALCAAVFATARRRGRFSGDSPFEDQKRRAAVKSHLPFSIPELNKLFASAKFEIKPKHHNTKSALPWAAAIAAYSGARREEIAQLRAQDLRKIDGVWSIDITPDAGKLKTKSSKRIVPVHSKLIAAGLIKYHAALPADGRLFPGLKARASKNKFGAALGEAFERWRRDLGIVRPGVTFHSFRHGVASELERAGAAQTDVARILGHEIEGMSFGVYSRGPGLARLRNVVELIQYPGLKQ
jgi:integrase